MPEAQQIQLRSDTAANWTSKNPILAQGEKGIESDTGREKTGDGVSAWSALSYFGESVGGSMTNAQVVAAYNAQVPVVTQTEAEEGTVVDVRRFTPERVAQAISAIAAAAGSGDMLAANNLSELTSAASALANLNAWSIPETQNAIDSALGPVFYIPQGALTINCATRAEAVANFVYIQDKLDNYVKVCFPVSGGVTDGFDIADPATLGTPLGLNDGQHTYGFGPERTQIRMWPGENMDAVIASKNWIENDASSPPSGLARNIYMFGVGTDGQYRNRTTGAELQTAGAGHGIALACFTSTIDWCGAAQTRGAGLFIDTTGRDGTTALGEGLETHITNSIFTRCGYNGIHVADTAAIAGGVTDMYLKSNAIAHCNQRGAVNDFGSGIFIQSGGGWEITGNHIYGTEDFVSGNWAGYGPTQYTHGIEVKSAFGTRFIGNQIADFGYHLTDTSACYGISIQLQERRGAIAIGNTVYTDQDNHDVAPKDSYCIRVTTKSNEDGSVILIGNNTESRRLDSHGLASTLKGIKLDTATGGTLKATVVGNLLYGVADLDALTGNADLTNVVITGNSWQPSQDMMVEKAEAMIIVDAASDPNTARVAGWGEHIWKVDNGVNPVNATATEIIFERPA